jgi:hypothetical protein
LKPSDSKLEEHSGAQAQDVAAIPGTGEETRAATIEQVLLIEPVWTGPYVAYLARKELPEDPMVARHIVRRSKSFTLINGELYK